MSARETIPAVMSQSLPMPEPGSSRQIWSVGGGKGGIGKTLITAALGWHLARLGKRVVLVDADLGGANLHTCLGLHGPTRTLGDFMSRRVETIEEVLVDTGIAGLRLVSGGGDFLGAANINYQQKLRLLSKVRELDVDIVLIDLGAGTSFNTLDFFLASDLGLLLVVPEPTSVENGYRFIKSALFRRLRAVAATDRVRELVDSGLDSRNAAGIRTPLDLLAAVEAEDPEQGAAFRAEVASFRPRFVVNQVREPSDVAVGHQLVTACARHLGVRASYAGFVDYDETVWRCVRQRRLFMAEAPASPAAERVRQVARMLLHRASLRLPW
jgi:flagellar biosynthesis protein FlhG